MSPAPSIGKLEAVIRATLRGSPHVRSPKQGSNVHTKLADRLRDQGWSIATEYPVRGDAWRDNEGRPAPAERRAIDIAIMDGDDPWGFIEVESDLDHAGKTGTGSHYSVRSIARSTRGRRFMSYQSLERMAVAVNPNVGGSPIVSDDPAAHNPRLIPLYLVVHNCTEKEIRVLEPRCRSLGAKIIAGWKR